MKRKCTMLILLIVILLITTGCWNRRELNELAITMALGIDLTKDGKYVVTAQVVNPGEVAGKSSGATGSSPVIIFQETGKTIFEAIRKMTNSSPRSIYPSHLRMLVIGESLAKEGIGKPLDLLSRDWELRSDFFIVVAKGRNAEDILKIPTSLEKIPANKLFDALEVSEKAWAASSGYTLDELIKDMISDGKQPVLTGVRAELKGDKTSLAKQNVEMIDPHGRLYYQDLAVFDGEHLIGWLDEKQSRTYNAITNKVKSTVVNVKCPKGGNFVYQIIKSHAEVKGKIKNGEPKIDIKIRAEGNVGEIECNVELTKSESIAKLEKMIEKQSDAMFTKAVQQIQENKKVDIFGFGEVLHRADPKAWKTLKNDWDQKFEDLPVNIKVQAEIKRVGTVGNSFLEKIK
ncbi:spore germination protein KC [Oikeobacillus pervagus]|uniref:Spore germination protein KC n=1 Tax=Oikeobacillus pervagus TaxID=1325931 RepID=A0AAJ1WJS3_9BACI|nr:Ger(x)C family spore germination protein [Oikeobacillus pervagus]MDQ0215818.1 spore germination protein KC [Oikeobacillus pervagus]